MIKRLLFSMILGISFIAGNPTYATRIFASYDKDTFYGISFLGEYSYDYVYVPNHPKNFTVKLPIGIVYYPVRKLMTRIRFSTGFRQAIAILTDPANTSVSQKGKVQFASAGTMNFKGIEGALWCKIAKRLTAKIIQQYIALRSMGEDPYHVFVLPTDKNQILFYPKNTTKVLVDLQISSWLSTNANLVVIYDNYGYNPKNVVTSSGQYKLLNINVIINTDKLFKGDLILSGYNLLDSDPLIPMPTAPGTGTNMVPIPGSNFNVSYRMTF